MTLLFPQAVSVGARSAGDGSIVQTPILHLDAADIDSYAGSGQVWADISGHGRDFNFGSSAGSDSSDPAFVGVPGAGDESCYMLLDGGDSFSAVAEWNGSTLRNLGRSDIEFTLEYWLYASASFPTYGVIFANTYASGGSTPGFGMIIGADGKPAVQPYTAGTFAGLAALNADAWNHVAFAGRFNGSTPCIHYLNGEPNGSFTATAAHASGDSYDRARLGYNGGNFLPAGWRYHIVRAYDFALSSAQIAQNFNAQRWRFGL